MLKKPPSAYYRISILAKEWKWEVSDILHYGGTGELQLCLLVPDETLLEPIMQLELNSLPELIEYTAMPTGRSSLYPSPNLKLIEYPGPYPISKEDVLKIRNAGWGPRERICNNLVVSHEEKLRFKKEYALELEKEMGAKERENLLRLIGAFIEIHYQGKDYKKVDGSPNANKISEKFHEQLVLNDFSDKGISDKSFRKLIPEAYDLIMKNKEEKTKISIKKISPT